MGQSLNPLRTHEEVPDAVKLAVLPVDYTPAAEENRPSDRELCEDCREYFGWFCWSTNCDWCGRQLCTRCCPDRHLLGGKPGCTACTRKAFQARRLSMLEDHLDNAGMPPPRQQGAMMGSAPISSAPAAAGGADALSLREAYAAA
ncbi:hypothetical protein NESM_000395000 [Novymonas esmeraldas]|uniref:Uncharacterized protein n=1 Tax=Novymonas esmeraldas TaxID=1808958 RepID=A0AAW0EP80_9TRYP